MNSKPISSTKKYKREWSNKNRKTFDGYSRQVYRRQVDACKTRGMSKPEYSLQEFQEWLRGQDIFWVLFNKWKETRDRKIQPSVDRINNNITYKFNNIQVITLWDNLYIKGQQSRIKGSSLWKNTLEGKKHLERLKKIGAKTLHRERKIICEECGNYKITRSAKARFCSRKCEQRNRRRRNHA